MKKSIILFALVSLSSFGTIKAMEKKQEGNFYRRFDSTFYNMEIGTASGEVQKALKEAIQKANENGKVARIVEFGPGEGLSTKAHLDAIIARNQDTSFILYVFEKNPKDQEKIVEQWRTNQTYEGFVPVVDSENPNALKLVLKEKPNQKETNKTESESLYGKAWVYVYRGSNGNILGASKGLYSFEDQSIDLIFSYYALHCLNPTLQIEFYRQANRILKPEGKIVATAQDFEDFCDKDIETLASYLPEKSFCKTKIIEDIENIQQKKSGFEGFWPTLRGLTEEEWKSALHLFETASDDLFFYCLFGKFGFCQIKDDQNTKEFETACDKLEPEILKALQTEDFKKCESSVISKMKNLLQDFNARKDRESLGVLEQNLFGEFFRETRELCVEQNDFDSLVKACNEGISHLDGDSKEAKKFLLEKHEENFNNFFKFNIYRKLLSSFILSSYSTKVLHSWGLSLLQPSDPNDEKSYDSLFYFSRDLLKNFVPNFDFNLEIPESSQWNKYMPFPDPYIFFSAQKTGGVQLEKIKGLQKKAFEVEEEVWERLFQIRKIFQEKRAHLFKKK